MWLWLQHWALISLVLVLPSKQKQIFTKLSILFSFNEFRISASPSSCITHVLFVLLTFITDKNVPMPLKVRDCLRFGLGQDFPPSSPMEEIKQLPDCKYQVGDVFCALAVCSILVPNVMPHTYYNTFLIKNCFNQPKLFLLVLGLPIWLGLCFSTGFRGVLGTRL